MEAGPAHFAFSGQAFAVIGGDGRGFFEGRGDLFDVGVRIFKKLCHTEFGRVDANHAVLARAVFVENFRYTTGHLHRVEKFAALLSRAHRRIAHGAGPNGRDQRANIKTFADNEIGDAFQFIIGGVGVSVRQKKKIIDAVEFLPIHLGGRSEVEHVLEADRRFLAFVIALADESGPHGIV